MITSGIQEQFDNAKHIVFMTGAGISTPSGIPDYRSKDGIYQGVRLRPEYLLSATAFSEEPMLQYQFMKDNMYFPCATPNIIHNKMAQLTKQNRAKIITQNVDDLHVKADSNLENLIRFHGSLYDIYAPIDDAKASVSAYLKQPKRADGQWLRPRITFYEEEPFEVGKSIQWIKESDLIVIVGTSFQVYPFAGLLAYAQIDVPIVSVNLERIDTEFPVTQIIGDAVTFFEELNV